MEFGGCGWWVCTRVWGGSEAGEGGWWHLGYFAHGLAQEFVGFVGLGVFQGWGRGWKGRFGVGGVGRGVRGGSHETLH